MTFSEDDNIAFPSEVILCFFESPVGKREGRPPRCTSGPLPLCTIGWPLCVRVGRPSVRVANPSLYEWANLCAPVGRLIFVRIGQPSVYEKADPYSYEFVDPSVNEWVIPSAYELPVLYEWFYPSVHECVDSFVYSSPVTHVTMF